MGGEGRKIKIVSGAWWLTVGQMVIMVRFHLQGMNINVFYESSILSTDKTTKQMRHIKHSLVEPERENIDVVSVNFSLISPVSSGMGLGTGRGLKRIIMNGKMKPEEFKQLLKQHDWNYVMSDDRSAISKGEKSSNKIQSAMHGNEELKKIYNKFVQDRKVKSMVRKNPELSVEMFDGLVEEYKILSSQPLGINTIINASSVNRLSKVIEKATEKPIEEVLKDHE